MLYTHIGFCLGYSWDAPPNEDLLHLSACKSQPFYEIMRILFGL